MLLNVITLGHIFSDHINQLMAIIDCFFQWLVLLYSRCRLIGSLWTMEKVIPITEWSHYLNSLFQWIGAKLWKWDLIKLPKLILLSVIPLSGAHCIIRQHISEESSCSLKILIQSWFKSQFNDFSPYFF